MEESEATNKEDEKWNGTGPIKNMEAFLADLQKAVDEGVKRGVKGGMEDSLEESVKKGIEDYRNSYVKKPDLVTPSVVEGLDDEQNDGIEDAKKWAMKQKQSQIGK